MVLGGRELGEQFLRITTENDMELLAQEQNDRVMGPEGGRWGTCVMEIVRRRFLKVGVALLQNPCTVRNTARLLCRSMSMKALIIEEFGDSSKLKYTEVPKPEPAEGEVQKTSYKI